MTTSGEYCRFPFQYRGKIFYDCTKSYHHRPWCSLDPVYRGRWGDCSKYTVEKISMALSKQLLFSLCYDQYSSGWNFKNTQTQKQKQNKTKQNKTKTITNIKLILESIGREKKPDLGSIMHENRGNLRNNAVDREEGRPKRRGQ